MLPHIFNRIHQCSTTKDFRENRKVNGWRDGDVGKKERDKYYRPTRENHRREQKLALGQEQNSTDG